MRIIDSHFHWWPRSFYERLMKRDGFPHVEVNNRGGYAYTRREGAAYILNSWTEWFDLDDQLAYMDSLGHDIGAVLSCGPIGVHFSDVPTDVGKEDAIFWNEEMASAQKRYPGRVWASAAIPLTDTQAAIDVLDDAVGRLGLMGANLPGSVGEDQRIDAERLHPFYARVEELGIPLFLHPTDAVFPNILEGYDEALHLSLGRVIEVSVAASRLILSGLMEKFPDLKIVLSHTGGALPYQSGRMDKNSKKAKLPRPTSEYMKRMFSDTVSPHMEGIRFAIEYYGVEHVMYGSDYPCWEPKDALRYFTAVGLPEADQEKILYSNARRILGLRDPEPATPAKESVVA